MGQVTGERPGWGQGYDYDESRHLVAYRWAAGLAAGRRVLDAGCGEGFGTVLLAEAGGDVVGLDRAPEAIAAAGHRWARPGLAFRAGDLAAEEGRYDLVTCFQVLEHQRDDHGFVRRLAGLLAPGGTLVLTTPNVLRSFSENPHHVREYRPAELADLLGQTFAEVTLRGVTGNARVTAFDAGRERAVRRVLALDPLGLRHRLPAPVVAFAFARLSGVVRRRARRAVPADPITPDDFAVRDGALDDALDLLAVCR